MGARRYGELIAWQLADELRREVIAFTARPPTCHDRRFCDQIRSAADSACSNTAEGFGRFNAPEFRRFLVVAKASVVEVQDRLESARQRAYLPEGEFKRLYHLADRAIGVNIRLQQYLRRVRNHGRR